MLADDLSAGHQRKEADGVAEDLPVCHVRGDQGENLLQKGQGGGKTGVPVGIQQRGDDFALAVRPAEIPVGIQFADAGVGQCLLTVQEICSLGKAAAGLPVDPLGFVVAQVYLHASQKIDDVGKLVEVHLHVAVDVDAEIVFQSLIQKGHSAGGVGHIDPVLAVAGDFDIGIPEEGSHGQFLFGFVEGTQDHGIRTRPGLVLPAVLTDEQNVDDVAVPADVGVVVREGDVLGVHGGGGVDLLRLGGEIGVQLLRGKGRGGAGIHIVDAPQQVL